jgi:hypothetical protein
MPPEPVTDKSTTFLGGFASILSLLGITLFFSGWIYRWAYYAYFSLNLNDQSFTAQSFLIVPIQIYLGTPSNLLKTFLLLLALPILITATLALIRFLSVLAARLPGCFPALRRLPALPPAPPEARLAETRRFLASLVDELVIVGWVLILLFWFSQDQGLRDARRDAVENTSTLPSVSLVLPQRDGILAQDLRVINDSGEPIPDPPLANQVLIGDAELARELRSTTLSDPNKQVWRLLNQEANGWLYLIRTIAAGSNANERPLVVAVPNAKRGQTLVVKPPLPK